VNNTSKNYKYPSISVAHTCAKAISFAELRKCGEEVMGFKEWFCKRHPETAYIFEEVEE